MKKLGKILILFILIVVIIITFCIIYSTFKINKPSNVYYTKALPGKIMAMTIPPFGIFIEERYKDEGSQPGTILAHERIHWLQYQERGFLRFYYEYFGGLIKHGRLYNDLEKDARERSSIEESTNTKIYVNNEYEFSFEYPISYKIEEPEKGLNSRDNQKYVIKLSNSEETVLISYVNQKILDLSTGKYGSYKIYFDEKTNEWMSDFQYEYKDGTGTEIIRPNYTKGDLPYFLNHRGVYTENAVALSHDKFVLIAVGNSGPVTDVVDRITSTVKSNK